MKTRHHKTLFDLVRGERRRYVLATLALAVGAGCTFVAPLAIGQAIDALLHPEEVELAGPLGRLGGRPVRTLLVLAALAGVLGTLAAGALQYLGARNTALASESIVRRLRETLYTCLEHLPCAFHDRTETGDLVQRCTSDVETVRVFLAAQVTEIGRALMLLLFALPVLLWISVPMTFLALGAMPFVVAFAFFFYRRIKRLFTAQDEAEAALTTVLQENLTGIRVVRAFARQEHERERFGRANLAFLDETRRLFSTLGSYWALSDLLCLTQIGVVLLVGADRVATQHLTLGELNTFLLVQALVLWPMRQLGRILNEAGRAVVALGRLGDILDEEEEEEGRLLSDVRGELVFERVSFAYADGTPALRDVSLRAAPGERIALVGPPGSGKSTVVRLLLKLYEPQSGSIRLDGDALAELSPRSVRASIGAVLQEPFLYSKTVRQNVLVGRAAASEEELVQATTEACLHGSVTSFDSGYETLVGERGVTLSGGQRQRVAIARALLKDPAVLLFDDALSAVDTRTEHEILSALDAGRERTTVTVTHRLASVVGADRIYVFDRGRVVETGTHAELLALRAGAYRRLWNVQNTLEDELSSDLHEESA